MKLKNICLVATCLFLSLTLTACHEKTPEKGTPQKEQMTPQNKLAEFNRDVLILPQFFNLERNQEGVNITYDYKVLNVGAQGIKNLKWYSVVSLDNTIVDIFAVPVNFQTELGVKQQVTITFKKALSSYTAKVQEAFLKNSNLQVNMHTIAGEITLADGKTLSITNEQMLEEEIQTFINKPKARQAKKPSESL